MAEGLCRYYMSDHFEPFSAGIEKHGLNPLAVKVMAEIGIDISGHYSKTIEELDNSEFEIVVTVCDYARETCPLFPALSKLIHRSFDDPPELAAESASEEEVLAHYRRVRDEIREFILSGINPDILNSVK